MLPAASENQNFKKLVEVVKGRDSKVVVFSQFLSALELAQRALKTSGLACVAPGVITRGSPAGGGLGLRQRAGRRRVLLTLDHAQSAGLTLTVASVVVLLDPVLDTSILTRPSRACTASASRYP